MGAWEHGREEEGGGGENSALRYFLERRVYRVRAISDFRRSDSKLSRRPDEGKKKKEKNLASLR